MRALVELTLKGLSTALMDSLYGFYETDNHDKQLFGGKTYSRKGTRRNFTI